MVIQTLLSDLKRVCESDHKKRKAIIYFYCDRAESDRRDPTDIMRTLVKQLSVIQRSSPSEKLVAAPVVDAYKKRDQTGHLDFQESCDLLIQLINQYSQTTIVIDALDEIDPAKRKATDFLNKLKQIIDRSESLVKLFVSSRDDGDIVLGLDGVPNMFISAIDSSSDIKRFIDRELERRPLLSGKASSELTEKVKWSLVQKAGGM